MNTASPLVSVAGAAGPTGAELFELRHVAANEVPADLAFRGGRVVHVHTGEVRAART